MDELNVFPRTENIILLLLLDGHVFHPELSFLKYINDPLHEYVVSIGVHYGASYWLIAYYAERNGSNKMAHTRTKREQVLIKRGCPNKGLKFIKEQ
jgi:hypothetical protein